jgi:hypothetical protein
MVSADFQGLLQQDQMARPAINTVLLLRDNLNFNAAIPSAMGAVPAIFSI